MKNTGPNTNVQSIINLASTEQGVEVMWLYGSRADNTEQCNSDVDLAVAFSTYIRDPLERALRVQRLAIEWTDKLKLPEHHVSLVDINHIPTALAWEVISKGRPILGGDTERAFWEFDRIAREYEIDVVSHRIQYG